MVNLACPICGKDLDSGAVEQLGLGEASIELIREKVASEGLPSTFRWQSQNLDYRTKRLPLALMAVAPDGGQSA